MIAGIAALAIGVTCLTASALAWTGRWRSWTRQYVPRFGATPITLLPGLGVAAVAGGLNKLGALSASSTFGALSFVCLLVGVLLAFATPRWWGPRWYRRRDVHAPLGVSDPTTALLVAGSRATSPPRDGAVRSRPPQAVGLPLKRWRGSWMVGDEQDPAAHGLTHAGAVYGHLGLHASAITFVASRVEDLMLDHPTVLSVAAGDLRAVRVVPAGAGPDGRPRKVSGARSVLPRLVLDTADGAFLFEVQFAKRTARRIRSGLGLDGDGRESEPGRD